MYATSTASTTTSGSGGIAGGSVPIGNRRMRVIRLLRPRRSTPAFGFSLRGGKEHGSGFFISKVEFSSEAHLQGLRAGDQLVSVNGYRVDDAVHTELIHYLASQSRLKIKVRHVGMLPVKEKAHESMTWQFVSDHASLGSDVSSSPTLCHDVDRLTDIRLSVLVPPGAKLGCGICKGPEWKPGIFVQFVREGGIAREAGLRPGDQILSCNGLNFGNVSFDEAISAMKASGRLELVVHEGAGTELVSPESSGYNSSASSAAGERSPATTAPHVPLAPPAALRRRLASVAEEAADRADRLTMNRLKRRTWDSLDFDWKNNDSHNFDAPSDIEPDYDSPSIPNNPHTYESKSNVRNIKDFVTTPSNKTIINLTENGATIECGYNNQSPKKNNFIANSTSRGNEKKTVVVDVHHTISAPCGKATCSTIAPPVKKDFNSETSSVSSSNTLSSAIADELLRRKNNKKNLNLENITPPNPVKKNMPKTIDNEQKQQHDALMNEFKKVHRKMFLSNSGDTKAAVGSEDTNDKEVLDRKQTSPVKKLDHTLPNNTAADNHPPQKREATDDPPPPPPMPTINGHRDGSQPPTESDHQKPIFKLIADLKAPNCRKNGTLTRIPTPDYDKTNTVQLRNKKDDKAELESLESYKLKNPASVQPKPPSNYFVKAPNGTATMKKHVRPVSVTIGEYSHNGNGRREPTKLEFLNGDRAEDLLDTGNDVAITNRLQSELALTLSRSNLRKKTEALVAIKIGKIIDRGDDYETSLDKHFHLRYGNNLLPLSPTITIPKVKNKIAT